MRIRQASKYSPQIGEVLQSFIPTKFRRIVHIYTQDPVFGRKHLEVQTMTITTIWKRKMSQKDEVGRFTKQKKRLRSQGKDVATQSILSFQRPILTRSDLR